MRRILHNMHNYNITMIIKVSKLTMSLHNAHIYFRSYSMRNSGYAWLLSNTTNSRNISRTSSVLCVPTTEWKDGWWDWSVQSSLWQLRSVQGGFLNCVGFRQMNTLPSITRTTNMNSVSLLSARCFFGSDIMHQQKLNFHPHIKAR